jgi:hypothetical protein
MEEGIQRFEFAGIVAFGYFVLAFLVFDSVLGLLCAIILLTYAIRPWFHLFLCLGRILR